MVQFCYRYLVMLLVVITSIGCGENNTDRTSKNATNYQSVDDLKQLFSVHPEFSQATLKDIKDSALRYRGDLSYRQEVKGPTLPLSNSILEKKEATFESPEITPAVITEPDPKDTTDLSTAKPSLDGKTAAVAQELIDTILDDFDFGAFYTASIKVVGIGLNEAHEQFKQFEELAQEMERAYGDKRMGMPAKNFAGSHASFPSSPFDDDKFSNDTFSLKGLDTKPFDDMPTCESLMNDPLMKATTEMVQRSIDANKSAIKKSLSGCAKVLGARFLECVALFNRSVEVVNKHASCDMKTISELEKATENDLGESFLAHNEKLSACMKEDFSHCGYAADEMPKAALPPSARIPARSGMNAVLP